MSTKKQVEKAENRLEDALEKLQREESRQNKAGARKTELKPAQAKKFSKSIRALQKNVEKAQKELTRAQVKHAKASGQPAQSVEVGVSDSGVQETGDAIAQALKEHAHVIVTGALKGGKSLTLELGPGQIVEWRASFEITGPETAIILKAVSSGDGNEDDPVPEFQVAGGAEILSTNPDSAAIESAGVNLRIDGGTVRSLRGDGILSDGRVELTGGVVAAGGLNEGASRTIQGKEISLKGGFVLGSASDRKGAGDGVLSNAAVVQPAADDMLSDGACSVCVCIPGHGTLPGRDGSEEGLIYWPEDACVWWDVAPDGATSIYAGRNDQSNSVFIGSQKLPGPPAMRTSDTEIVSLPIIFEARTAEADRNVLLDIAWGWDLFLTEQGADKYDNRLAIAACALASSVYHEQAIQELLKRMGFSEPVLDNYGNLNNTSAFALAHTEIEDANGRKTLFAVVNRGSKTIMDWKGNILDETIQNAQFFGQCADNVSDALRDYVQKHGQKEAADNLFFVTGHSLGAIVTDLLAVQHFGDYPARNVFAYAFAAPLADPSTTSDDSRPVYNILNQNDVVTSFPPRPGYKRIGTNNYAFSTKGKNAAAMARSFRFLSHMDIDELSRMSSFTGFFAKAIPSIMWNHSLTTYMSYLLAGGPDSVTEKGGLWSVVQSVIAAVGKSGSR